MDMAAWAAMAAAGIALLSAITTIIFSTKQNIVVRAEALKLFYEEGNAEEIGKIMTELHEQMKMRKAFDRAQFPRAGKLFGFYDKWCTLCVRGYLPCWVFKGNPGHNLVVFYAYTRQYIEERRKMQTLGVPNPNYSLSIEVIAKKVERKYQHG